MKILSFGHIPQWAGGKQTNGLSVVVYNLASAMSKEDDVEMYIAATDVKEVVHDGKLTIIGWNYRTIIKSLIKAPLKYLSFFFYTIKCKIKYGPNISLFENYVKGVFLSETISKIEPDVLHLHGDNSLYYSHVVPRSVKIVATFHGMSGKAISLKNHEWAFKKERDVCHSERFSKIFFIASQLIEDFERSYGRIVAPTQAIPNAYNSSLFYYVEHEPQERLSLCTIASLSELKGQSRVIEAIAKAGVSVNYFCIGSGPEDEVDKLEKLAKMSNVDFEYLGKKKPDEIRLALSRADYMIMPSTNEGFGLSYLESIACGVPVILPKNLPIVKEKEIIKPGVNAILLEDCYVESIINVLRMIQNYKFNRSVVSKSIRNCSWSHVAGLYVEAFRKL